LTLPIADNGRAWVPVVAALWHLAFKEPQVRIDREGKNDKPKLNLKSRDLPQVFTTV